MDRITITTLPIVSPYVLETIASQQHLTKSKARAWLKRHVLDVVKSSFIFVDGVPHTYKNSDYRFVTASLLSAGVAKEEEDKFFYDNFVYSEPIASSSEMVFAENVMYFSRRLAKQTMKENSELAEILKK